MDLEETEPALHLGMEEVVLLDSKEQRQVLSMQLLEEILIGLESEIEKAMVRAQVQGLREV